MSDRPYQTFSCRICAYVYDEATGLPADGIAPGTRWEDLPPHWTCPDCQAGKEDFDRATA